MPLSAAIQYQDRTKRVPPHLRRGNAKQRCQLCVHYQAQGLEPGRGRCKLYDYPVRAALLSDSFKKKD